MLWKCVTGPRDSSAGHMDTFRASCGFAEAPHLTCAPNCTSLSRKPCVLTERFIATHCEKSDSTGALESHMRLKPAHLNIFSTSSLSDWKIPSAQATASTCLHVFCEFHAFWSAWRIAYSLSRFYFSYRHLYDWSTDWLRQWTRTITTTTTTPVRNTVSLKHRFSYL